MRGLIDLSIGAGPIKPEKIMTLNAARSLLASYRAVAALRPLDATERNAVSCLKARIRRLTGNHFAV